MPLLDLLRFSAGALRGHRIRTFLSVLGVTIGVASVIMLTSLGEGARLYVMGEFSTLGSTLLIILPGKSETSGGMPIFGRAPNELTLEDVEAVRQRVRNVRRVAPLAIGAFSARRGEKSREITVVGTTNEFLAIRSTELSAGRFLPEGEINRDERVCVIGSTVRQELFGAENPLGEFLHVGGERYRVIGVTASQGTTLSGNVDEMVFVPVVSMLRMLNRSGLFRVFVEVNSMEQIAGAKRDVTALLKTRHNNMEDVTVFTQDAVLATFDRILSMLTYALGGIAAISLGVAGIGIMNVMLVSVAERVREIGLLKALGATRGQILAVFLFEAAILSTVGGLVGLGLGMAAARTLQYVYPVFPAQPPQWAVIAAVAVSMTVGIFFGALPARRASRLDPITALARR